MRVRRIIVVAVLLVASIAGGAFLVVRYLAAGRSVADAVGLYGRAARSRMQPYFSRAHVPYPPARLALLVFKKEKRLSVWAASREGNWRFIRAYPILAASGKAGPKLREGDYQVPEGIYRIAWLNPNSSYHLSMKVSYPNAFDLAHATTEKRTRLGGDIFIHGNALSIGCIAVGDIGIEELFTLVADAGGAQSAKVILAPNDLRIANAPLWHRSHPWIATLYKSIATALAEFPVELESNSAFEIRGMRKESKVLETR
jgi:hypothetical protein